jgi:hypothetical protein
MNKEGLLFYTTAVGEPQNRGATMSDLISKISHEVLKRATEETVQSAMEAGIRGGEDTNSLVRRVFKSVLGDDTPLVGAINKIPGVRFAPNIGLSLVAEFLNSHSDKLFRGDNRAPVQALRLALKAASPVLMGIGDATADVLEKRVNEASDRAVSPVGRTENKGRVDRVVVVPTFFGMRAFFPVVANNDGSVAQEDIGGYNIPRVLDATFVEFRDNWVREYPKSGNHTPPWRVYSLQEYVTMIEGRGDVDLCALKALKDSGKPASNDFSEETYAVFRAVVRTQRHFTDSGDRNWLDRRDFESLIEKFLNANVPVPRANQLIGKAFIECIDGETGLLSLDDLRDFETVVDVFLSGEQDAFTKILRRWRDLRSDGYAQGDATWWLSLGVIGFTAPIWAPLVLICFFLLIAVYMAIAGVFTPLEGTQTFFGREINGQAYAFWMAFASGWLAFATTWLFPIVQLLTAWTRYLYPRLKDDWLVSLGRRISGFGLTVISAMIPVAILCGASWEDRVLILAATGFTMGMAYALVEAGWRYHVERSVLKASPLLNMVFGAGVLAYAYAHPLFASHPQAGDALVDAADAAKDSSVASEWLQLTLLFVVLLCVSAIITLIEHRKVPQGPFRMKIRFVGLLMLGIVVTFALHLVFGGKKMSADEQTTASATATTQEAAATTSGDQKIDRKKLCADPRLSHERREKYCKGSVP